MGKGRMSRLSWGLEAPVRMAEVRALTTVRTPGTPSPGGEWSGVHPGDHRLAAEALVGG